MSIAAITAALVALIPAITAAIVAIRTNGKVTSHLADHDRQATPK
jgi:hypothetical protein